VILPENRLFYNCIFCHKTEVPPYKAKYRDVQKWDLIRIMVELCQMNWRWRIQITLIVAFVIALIRIAVVFYERSHWTEAPKPQPVSSSSYRVTLDDYVTPHRIFPYDIASAKHELAGKTVWIRAGNQFPYYRYVASRVDLSHSAGLLGPLEKLEIKDVIAQSARGGKQAMAIFSTREPAGEYAFSIGTLSQGSYDFSINDILFLEDPHQLYNHWPAEVWDAIDHHEIKPGMNERQGSFALGTDIRVSPGDYGNRTVEYLNAGKPVTVTFSDNKAVTVEPEAHR